MSLINRVWVSYLNMPKKGFIGCRYLDLEEKKIFEYDGENWKSVDVLGHFGLIMILNPPSAYYVDGQKIVKCKKKDLKRFGISA